ncbi:MAG: hypothetical protein ABR958_01690 [Dehalococcoidales bacterium]
MQRERSLSDFWREDKSDDRVMELTSVLRGADSLIGVMGSGVRTVWSTDGSSSTVWLRMIQSKATETRVFLDYSPLADLRPPFGGQAVDEVIGYAAHEGGHCLWSAEDTKTYVDNALKGRIMPTTRATRPHDDKNRYCPCPVCEILRIDNILEDAFIDYHVAEKWPVLGEYIRWARYKIADRRPIDYDQIAREARPGRNCIVNLWIACSLYDKPLPDKMSARVKRAMTFLMSKSVQAVQTPVSQQRAKFAVECWEYLNKEFTANEEPLPRQPPPALPQTGIPGVGQAGGQGEGEGKGGGGGSSTGQDNVPKETKPEGSSEETDTGKDNVPEKGKAEGEGEEAEAGEPEGDEGEGDGEGDVGGEGSSDKDDEAEPEAEAEAGEPKAEGQKQAGGQQGGDEQGAPGNLDDFDIRELGEVPEKVIKEVLDAIAHELEDLSQSVAEVINQPVGRVNAQTKIADYDGPAADRVHAQVEPQIQEMRRVFDRQAQVKSRQIKGLTTGKLDSRSLARVGTGSLRVYKRREVLDTPDIAVGFLGDASGSMARNMDILYASACVFAEALIRKKGVNFLGLVYTGGSFDVQTTRICDRAMGRLCIGNVDQGGGTPSGPAIASIKVLMDRKPERQKVIIHFTDGYPDDQYSVISAVKAARKAGYAVWAIGLGGMDKALEAQYGTGNWETIGNIRELPAKVGELVKKLVIAR